MSRPKNPRFIVENGKRTAVVLDIDEYCELLDRLKDQEDFRQLDQIRQAGVNYRSLSEDLDERDSRLRGASRKKS